MLARTKHVFLSPITSLFFHRKIPFCMHYNIIITQKYSTWQLFKQKYVLQGDNV